MTTSDLPQTLTSASGTRQPQTAPPHPGRVRRWAADLRQALRARRATRAERSWRAARRDSYLAAARDRLLSMQSWPPR